MGLLDGKIVIASGDGHGIGNVTPILKFRSRTLNRSNKRCFCMGCTLSRSRKVRGKMKRFYRQRALLWTFWLSCATLALPVWAATPEKISASYGAISGTMAPIWVAKEARLFEKHGLDLSLVYIPGGPRSIMSLLGGSLQFVNHSGMPALEAYQRGADTALIASSMNQLEHAVVAHKNITSVRATPRQSLGHKHTRSVDRYSDARRLAPKRNIRKGCDDCTGRRRGRPSERASNRADRRGHHIRHSASNRYENGV